MTPTTTKRWGLALGCVLACLLPTGCLDGDFNPYAEGAEGDGTSGGIQPSNVCSTDSSTSVSLTIQNNYTVTPLNVFWVSYECQEVGYGSIEPGTKFQQQTFATHPWRLRNADTGVLLHEYVVTTEAGQTLVVP
jgi:hypothetical protein